MSRLTTITDCQRCRDSITALDIMTTHQARLCPKCLHEWQTQQDTVGIPARDWRRQAAGGTF